MSLLHPFPTVHSLWQWCCCSSHIHVPTNRLVSFQVSKPYGNIQHSQCFAPESMSVSAIVTLNSITRTYYSTLGIEGILGVIQSNTSLDPFYRREHWDPQRLKFEKTPHIVSDHARPPASPISSSPSLSLFLSRPTLQQQRSTRCFSLHLK